jgi:hypothetical protein
MISNSIDKQRLTSLEPLNLNEEVAVVGCCECIPMAIKLLPAVVVSLDIPFNDGGKAIVGQIDVE